MSGQPLCLHSSQLPGAFTRGIWPWCTVSIGCCCSCGVLGKPLEQCCTEVLAVLSHHLSAVAGCKAVLARALRMNKCDTAMPAAPG